MQTAIIKHTKSDALKKLENLALEQLKKQNPSFPYPVKPTYTDKTTNGLTSAVIKYIQLRGFQAERINSTGQQVKTKQGEKWVYGSGQTGTADISATIQGRAVKIEIKCLATGDSIQSPAQKEYQAAIEQAGGVYLLIRTFEQFYNWFNKK